MTTRRGSFDDEEGLTSPGLGRGNLWMNEAGNLEMRAWKRPIPPEFVTASGAKHSKGSGFVWVDPGRKGKERGKTKRDQERKGGYLWGEKGFSVLYWF